MSIPSTNRAFLKCGKFLVLVRQQGIQKINLKGKHHFTYIIASQDLCLFSILILPDPSATFSIMENRHLNFLKKFIFLCFPGTVTTKQWPLIYLLRIRVSTTAQYPLDTSTSISGKNYYYKSKKFWNLKLFAHQKHLGFETFQISDSKIGDV